MADEGANLGTGAPRMTAVELVVPLKLDTSEAMRQIDAIRQAAAEAAKAAAGERLAGMRILTKPANGEPGTVAANESESVVLLRRIDTQMGTLIETIRGLVDAMQNGSVDGAGGL